MLEHGHATHRGLRREHNEDNYWADTERRLWLVADGMGGPGRGEVASTIALDAAVSALDAGVPLAEVFGRAGAAIRARARQDTAAALMGCTLAILRLDAAGNYQLAWVGDSRIYIWQDGTLQRAKRPAVEADADAENPAPPPAPHERTTRALGITPATDLDTRIASGHSTPGMQFLLCSDGLTDELDTAAIAAIVARTDLAAQECVDHLLLAALDAGGHDNITAVLVRVG
ncbi:MAG TPA: PP2C family serine/threonine-protein phosphatase [Rhodanobacteraceae bacterium]